MVSIEELVTVILDKKKLEINGLIYQYTGEVDPENKACGKG